MSEPDTIHGKAGRIGQIGHTQSRPEQAGVSIAAVLGVCGFLS